VPNIGKGRVQERATLPVQMMRLHNGELVLDGQDNRLLEGDTGEPDNPYAVPAHPITVHTDVDIDTPTTGQALVYNGTLWVNDTVLADVGAAIEAAAAKTTPVDADDLGITDSAAANVLKKLSWANVKVGITAMISAFAAKTTPIDADSIVITDSAASDAPKRTTLTNFKAFLKTYFDTLYELAGAIATHAALTVTHGATGAIMGTTNAQSPQNKTYDSTNISSLTAKNPPIDADSAVIVDSAAANVFKAVTYTNIKAFLKTYFDTLYDLTATALAALATKTPPVGADAIVITDSAAANAPKRLTFTNLITYLTTLFMDLTTAQTVATGIKTFTPGIVSPSVDGSVIANGDLTLQGTTHATRTSSYVIVQPTAGNVAIGKTTAGAKLDVAGAARYAGTGTTPAADGTGQALELWYWTGAGGPYALVLAFDRDASTYKPLRIAGDSIGFEEGATRIMTIDGGNVGILVNPALTPLQVHVGTNQNLGVASVSSETTLTAYNDTGAANVPLRIAATRVRTLVTAGGSILVSATGVVGSEVELVAAGIITKGMRILGDAYFGAAGGREALGFQISVPGAGSTVVVTGGVFSTKLYSTGQLVVFRSSGAETYHVIVQIIYA
jgi:hypothetical protein